MKINVNLERFEPGTKQVRSAGIDAQNTGNIDSTPGKAPRSAQKISNKRNIIDAVIISQIAQGFFQKAVIISSKLKGIASEALTLGKISEIELNKTLNEISSLNEIRERFNNISVSLQTQRTMPHSDTTIVFPQMSEDLSSLKEYAEEILSGDVDLKKIDRINIRLSNQLHTLRGSFDRLVNELPVSDSAGLSDNHYPKLAQNTVRGITEFPQAALISQGNIGSGIVQNLL